MIRRFLTALERDFEERIAMTIMILIALLMGMQICARYVFNSSLSWTEEFCVYMLMWMGMISLSYCIRTNTSIKVEMMIDLFSVKIRRMFHILEDIVAIMFYGFMLIPAWQLFNIAVSRGQVSPALLMPMSLIQVAPLVAFALAVIRSFQCICLKLKNFPDDRG